MDGHVLGYVHGGALKAVTDGEGIAPVEGMKDGRDELSEEVVQLLLVEQFPQWANLEIKEVEHQGWDNRTFRLCDNLSVRLPSAEGYEPQVDREHRWLPFLAEGLGLSIPSPVAKGVPSRRLSRAWSVYRWLGS